ncbi:hypothetical protein HZH68_006453 [Vespula germanica]|uniref:Uncharacterized protein n=1 Tax=Vespula germanica TaxID=30212 RepID=A0A834KAV3_VESGE|nr:hypothetical protein HZH68_006453 [Vespula germanica]
MIVGEDAIEFLKSHSRELLNSRHTSEKGRLYFTKNFHVNWNKYDDKYSSSSGGVEVVLRWEGRVEKLGYHKGKKMFPPGIEPGTFRVLGGCDNHYTTETI